MHIGTQPGGMPEQGTSPRKEYRSSTARKLWDILSSFARGLENPLAISLCSFLFPFVSWFGIPSPCAAAFLIAQDLRGAPAVFALLGLAASLALRAVWGLTWDIWQYIGCLMALIISLRKRPHTPIGLALLGGIAMMPRAIAEVFGGNALSILLSCAAVPLCMGLAIAFKRGLSILKDARPMFSMQDKACAILLLLTALSGLGYLRIFTVNLGHLAAIIVTLIASYALGGLTGAVSGLLCGVTLALCGHDSRIAMNLALGGLFSGLVCGHQKRWLCDLSFLGGHILAFYLTPLTAPILSHWTALLGCAVFLFTSQRPIDRLRSLGLNTAPGSRSMEGLFVQQRLMRWEGAMRSMASALPAITTTDTALLSGKELSAVLCAGCPEHELCWGRNQQHTEMLLDEMMRAALLGESATAEQFPLLRDCPCIRLSSVPTAAAEARKSYQTALAAKVKARFEREMTITHLEAMAGIISEIRVLTCGDTMSDLQAAYQINKALRDLHFPAQLCYARRVDGHLQAALEIDALAPGSKQPDKFLRYLAHEAGLSLTVTQTIKNRIELEELPLYNVEVGVAALCAGQQTVWEDGAVSGDAIAAKQCQGGRFLLLLSDGMGHGAGAHIVSNKTLELLLLCMEAGYSRRQAITAVNGMMLAATDEDRFATMDLFDLSLWTGEVCSEKLGACSSWLVRGNYLKQIEGSSLPLGILEEVQPTSQGFRMHSGDILIVMSDGVSDVLSDPAQMERAILDSLYIQPQRMADALLRSALLASGGTPRDDMTVLTLLMVDRQRSDSFSTDMV